MTDQTLRGRVALVTGVSRRLGIGRAVADRLAGLGAEVHATGWSMHDAEMPWGADREAAVIVPDQRDLGDPSEPASALWHIFDPRHARVAETVTGPCRGGLPAGALRFAR
jgi:NAD(P)-dependent dehydrogenase (short-subunit alcohol dehydrogenase family)